MIPDRVDGFQIEKPRGQDLSSRSSPQASNLGIILQLMDVFADVAVWSGAGLTSLTPG